VLRELRELGERVRRPARGADPAAAGTESLTRREREVAELVASGATNREIADALVLSVKTVETHIAHIFAKLDVRSRAALTATLMRG
jgi:DNA-binding NarL/FixJ family response regulator